MIDFDTSKTSKLNKLVEASGIKHPGLLNALVGRGHSAEEIADMSAMTKLTEFLEWEGICGWADMIVEIGKAAGLKIYEPIARDPGDPEEMRKFLEGVVGVVEADRYTMHSLWEDFSEEATRYGYGRPDGRRFSWKSENSGLMTCVGTHGDYQTWISLTTAVVKGHKLLFYYSSGIFSDNAMVETWLKETLPDSCRGSFPGGYNHTDATNFCNIFRSDITDG